MKQITSQLLFRCVLKWDDLDNFNEWPWNLLVLKLKNEGYHLGLVDQSGQSIYTFFRQISTVIMKQLILFMFLPSPCLMKVVIVSISILLVCWPIASPSTCIAHYYYDRHPFPRVLCLAFLFALICCREYAIPDSLEVSPEKLRPGWSSLVSVILCFSCETCPPWAFIIFHSSTLRNWARFAWLMGIEQNWRGCSGYLNVFHYVYQYKFHYYRYYNRWLYEQRSWTENTSNILTNKGCIDTNKWLQLSPEVCWNKSLILCFA